MPLPAILIHHLYMYPCMLPVILFMLDLDLLLMLTRLLCVYCIVRFVSTPKSDVVKTLDGKLSSNEEKIKSIEVCFFQV